jgi:hypothetical protein
VWPTEPAKAGWSFNKWRETRIPKELRPNNRQRQNVHALAVVLGAAAELADVAVAAAVDAAAQAAVAPAEVVDRAAAVAVDKGEAAVPAAKAASAAAEAAKARVVIATVDAAMGAASSSRT